MPWTGPHWSITAAPGRLGCNPRPSSTRTVRDPPPPSSPATPQHRRAAQVLRLGLRGQGCSGARKAVCFVLFVCLFSKPFPLNGGHLWFFILLAGRFLAQVRSALFHVASPRPKAAKPLPALPPPPAPSARRSTCSKSRMFGLGPRNRARPPPNPTPTPTPQDLNLIFSKGCRNGSFVEMGNLPRTLCPWVALRHRICV